MYGGVDWEEERRAGEELGEDLRDEVDMKERIVRRLAAACWGEKDSGLMWNTQQAEEEERTGEWAE